MHTIFKATRILRQNTMRINFGVGGQFSNAYVAPVVRAGVDMFFGKSFFVTPAVNYIGRAKCSYR